MKRKLLLALPLAAGILFGQLVFSLQSRSVDEIISPEVGRPVRSEGNLSAAALPAGSNFVSDHLIKSQSLFSKAIELSSKNTDSSQNGRVVELINEAITEATQAIVASPQDSRGYEQRGKIYKTIASYLDEALPAALRDYQQAARLNPRQVKYFEQAADILLKLDRKPEAVEALKKCAYVNPTDPQGWYKLAKLEADLGMLGEAKDSYNRVLPLLADETQREAVKTEIKTIDKLIAQAGQENNPAVSSGEEQQLVFPDNPPKLEANASSGVIIAAPNEAFLKNEKGEISSNALSGKAILAAGEKEVKIENKNLTVDSQVYLAAEDDLDNEVLRVKSKSAGKGDKPGWFMVSISRPLEKSVSFRWWIIN